MVFTGAEIRNALTGGWEIFKGNPQGLGGFDRSVSGFWRSFLIIVPLAIPYLLISRMQLQIAVAELGGDDSLVFDGFYTIQCVRLAIDWIAFPVVLALLAIPLGISRHYVGFIVVRNWTELLAMVPILFAAVLFQTGVAGVDGFAFLSLMATGVAVYLRFRVARVALDASISFAAGIVVFDMVLSMVIGLAFSEALGLG